MDKKWITKLVGGVETKHGKEARVQKRHLVE